MPSPEQTLRNRIGGKLRQDPGADVTDLRRQLLGAKVIDQVTEWVRGWPPPTAEQVQAVASILQDRE